MKRCIKNILKVYWFQKSTLLKYSSFRLLLTFKLKQKIVARILNILRMDVWSITHTVRNIRQPKFIRCATLECKLTERLITQGTGSHTRREPTRRERGQGYIIYGLALSLHLHARFSVALCLEYYCVCVHACVARAFDCISQWIISIHCHASRPRVYPSANHTKKREERAS